MGLENSFLVFQHIEKISSTAENSKTLQAMMNKTPVFAQALVKLIDLNTEKENQFLSTQSVLNAFIHNFEGVNVKYVGKVFLDILDNGIFKVPESCKDLKPKDYSGT